MALIIAIDLIVVGALVTIALTKGLERALPFFTFAMIVVPLESKLNLAGMFDLTSSRVAIITLGVLFVVVGQNRSEPPEANRTPLNYLMLLAIGWGFISTLDSVVPTTSLKTVLSQFLDYYVVYYIFVKTVRNTRTLNKILFAFIGAMVVCCILGLLEVYQGKSVISLFPTITYRFSTTGGLDEGRVRSTFPITILFGVGLTLAIPIALYLLAQAKNSIERVYLWIAVVLMFWNNYKTSSRGPWLALILSAVLLMFAEGPIRKYLLIISLLTVSVLLIRPGVWETLKNTYVATINPDDPRGGSYQYRYDLMRAARQTLAKDFKRAVLGFGPESFSYLGLEGVDSTTGNIVVFESCDSGLVEIMVDTGYVGLFITALLLIKAALMSLRNYYKLPKPGRLLCLVLFINMVAFYFMMMSVMCYGWGQQSYMFWILVALSVTYPRLIRNETLSKDEVSTEQVPVEHQLVGVADM